MQYIFNKGTGQVTSIETKEVIKPFDRSPLTEELARIEVKITELEQRKTEIQSELDKYNQIVENSKSLEADKDGFIKIDSISLNLK